MGTQRVPNMHRIALIQRYLVVITRTPDYQQVMVISDFYPILAFMGKTHLIRILFYWIRDGLVCTEEGRTGFL